MRATDIIYPNLYGCEMLYAKIDIPKEKLMYCFIIAEHVSDKEYIESQAMEMLLAGGREFFFLGEYDELWHEIFDLVYVKMSLKKQILDNDHEFITINCEDLDEFAEWLYNSVNTRTIVPAINLLVYDDEKMYKDTLKQLEWLKQQNKIFHKARLVLKEMNPYGLADDSPTNEFYGEAERISEMVQEDDTVEVVAEKIASVLTKSFGEKFTTEACMEYARKILE